jgi:hypothetical protein
VWVHILRAFARKNARTPKIISQDSDLLNRYYLLMK